MAVKVIETIGRSAKNFQDAIQNGISELLKSGEKIYYFEVIEQKGFIRENEIFEFQVRLKAGMATQKQTEKSSEEFICPTCQQPAGEHGHMCVPVSQEDEKCDWCGSLIVNERHLCDDKVKEIAYVCNSCGRTAVNADQLCNPKKISK